MKKKPKYYEITLWSGANELFHTDIPVGCISDQKLNDLLRCLVGKAGLSFQEISDSYLKRNTRRYAPHLEINSECNRTRTTTSCGGDPYAVALLKHRSDEE